MKMNAKSMLKKVAGVALILALVLSLAACGSSKAATETATTETASAETASTETASTEAAGTDTASLTRDALENVTEEELCAKTGIDLPAPEGATDVTYNVLLASSEHPIAEMCFTLNGVKAFERAQLTSMTTLVGDQSDLDATLAAMDSEDYNISGLNYEWTEAGTNTVQKDECTAVVKTCEEAGYVAWLDVVPGILYNVGIQGATDSDTLMTIANAVFVPMQGEA